MNMEYQKPDVEFISFASETMMTTLNPSQGTTDYTFPEDE